jgi:hypothetical protein
MEASLKKINIGTVFNATVVGLGIYIAVKNYKKENFWTGFLAAALITGAVIKIG